MLFFFAWFRRRRRRKLLAQPFPKPWRDVLEDYPFYVRLDGDERRRLEGILRVVIAETHWEGVDGFELGDRARVTVAGLAALLVLNIEHDYYRRVTSILIHPSTYASAHKHRRAGGVQAEGTPLLGQAWYRGPVILSWESVQQGALNAEDGQNVVIHEFAHRLDMLDGFVDGTPPLRHRHAYEVWTRVMTSEYERLQAGRGKVLDRYGATNEGEFFAVATETFFEKPRQMKARHPDLYALLSDYYQQDPFERLRPSNGAPT